MKTQNNLLDYAMSFASFLIDSNIGSKINTIIIFGSVARGDFADESDIDLFIDMEEKYEAQTEKLLALFKESRIQKIWEQKGLKNELSLKVGLLKKWSLPKYRWCT